MKKITFLFTLLISQCIFCQPNAEVPEGSTDENRTKISTVLENYFDLEREAIHLHLCKTTFLTNESIWYQGYIIDRKTNKPFLTTNVFVLLFDEKGNKLSEKLIFANSGGFSGKIALDKTFHSGIYYLQVYTNWMNNFSENESTIQKIYITNPAEGIKNYTKINPQTLEILLTPEGGHLISGINNNVGIQIKDCRGNAPENSMATLQNNKGEILKTIPLSRFGFGKFDYYPSNENIKIVINYENTKTEKQLPAAEATGLAMNVNNYSIAGKTIINIKTNSITQKRLASKKLYLLIHQDQKHSLNEITLSENALEQTFTVLSSSLSSGINSIRIIDSDLNEYGHRLIYTYPKTEKSISLKQNYRKNDQINLIGYSIFPNAILSASILPEASASLNDDNNIFAGLTINPYLEEPLANANAYFQNQNKTTAYALDLALVNQQKSKYNWNLMKVAKPAMNYNFDIGLSLKGSIDPSIKAKDYHKVKLVSYKNLMLLTADITEKGEYSFDHVVISDSTYVEMSLLKLPDFEKVNTSLTPQVLNRKRTFNKGFRINIPEQCDAMLETLDFDLPEFSGKIIQLEEVKLELEHKLKYENQLGNANLHGYKIEGALQNQNLLQFIRTNGFSVIDRVGEVGIYSRYSSTLNGGQSTPAIFIDGRQILSFYEIETLQMSDIDEIFLNSHAIVANMGNHDGIIKIYTKKIKPFQYKARKNPDEFYIADGFAKYANFENANYQTIGNRGFNQYGLLEWSPRILTSKEGSFSITLTDYNHLKGKTTIQGITDEGVIFQEELDVELK